MKPAWLKTGLFSGDGKRALPIYSLPERKELQKDGSFVVDVVLEYDYIDLGHGRRAFYGRHSWRVATSVTAEDGRFVVEDVRMFSGASTDGPSHLLSDAFVGCQGPHWAGQSAANN